MIEAKLKNGGLSTKGGHKVHVVPKGWKLAGKKEKVAAWSLGVLMALCGFVYTKKK